MKPETRAANFASQTIWTGDNLDIMRGMNSASVDLIYLDPPFNSNRNYSAPIGSKAAGAAFKDTWTLDDIDEAWHGEIAERNPALYAAIGAAGLSRGAGMKSYLIMMAVRLLEMKRILKPTGSIYLHCDDTAVHYLKMLMDVIFGTKTFRGNIVWRRHLANNAGKNFGRIVDHILYYARKGFTWNQPFGPISEQGLKRYRYMDPDGRRYRGGDLTAPGPTKNNFTWRGTTPKHGWRHSLEKLEELWNAGLIHKKRDGTPALDGHKQYLDEHPGSKVQNLWADIDRVGNTAKERMGYPTQKPIALLKRIIETSSDPGDFVLDPFCGCATTCVAAEQLGRRWVGIDISEKAADLVQLRLREEVALMYQGAHRTDIPKRTDLGKIPNYRTQKHTLFGQQEGKCNGCLIEFPFRNFTIYHNIPQSKGGTDHIGNLQLLCAACNSKKGKRSMEELIADLKRERLRRE